MGFWKIGFVGIQNGLADHEELKNFVQDRFCLMNRDRKIISKMFSGDQLAYTYVNRLKTDRGVRNISDQRPRKKRAGKHTKTVRSVRKKIGSRVWMYEEVFASIHHGRGPHSGGAPIGFRLLLKFFRFGSFSSISSLDFSKIRKISEVNF